MIWAWLTAKKLGLAKGVWLLIALALLAFLWLCLDAREQAEDQRNREIGATVERERSATATIKQVEKANAAADNLGRSSDAARAECLQNARNPADC